MSLLSPLIGSFLGKVSICVMLTAVACGLAFPASGLDPNKSMSQFTHTAWSAKDGIPGPVRAIAQTPDGYLWIGTQAGLYRFDGFHFIPWEGAAGGEKFPRLPVWSLLTARDGSLWIGFSSGPVGRLLNGTLRIYPAGEGLDRGVLAFAEDLNGFIWAGGEYGFGRFESNRWKRVGAELGYRAPGAQSLAVDHGGTLWVVTNGADFGFDKDNISVNTILKLAPLGKQFEGTGQALAQVRKLAEAPDGQIWVVDHSGTAVRPALGRAEPNVVRAMRANPDSVVFDGESSIWIGLFHGGLLRAPDYHHLGHARFDRFDSKEGLSSDGVRTAFKDREGNIWFGTSRGLDRFRENKVTPLTPKEGLPQDARLSLTSTVDGTVWVVNFSASDVWRGLSGRIEHQELPAFSSPDAPRILSLHADGSRVLLGGNFGLAESTGGRFSQIRVPGMKDKEAVEAVTSDSSGNLWVVVWEGEKSRVMRLRNGAWTNFRDVLELPNYRCRVLFGDAQGRVWLGFETGEVAVYQNEGFHRYSITDGLLPGRVMSIANDTAGRVWIGGDGGASCFDGRRFLRLTKENGLQEISVSAIAEDDDGFLWLAGALGIVRVSPQEIERALKSSSYRMQTLLLDTTDGLPGLPVTGVSPTAVKSADGRLWFVTTDGIAVIDPRRLPMNTLPPTVAIQSVTADNQQFAISPQLHFRPKVQNVEIGFAAMSLSVPERVLFRYKLEGYDSDWHGPAGTRFATYTNLPPRKYRFRVAGSNNDGVWNELGAALEFDIAPMFYQTTWFLLLCGIVASFLTWAIYRSRLRQVTARLDLQYAERLSERESIARELHDTLLQAIQGLMLRFQAAAKGIPDHEPTRQVLEEALDRADEVMAEGRDRVRGLRASRDGGNDLLQAFSNVAQEFVDSSHTRCRVVVEGDVRWLHPLVRDEVYRIGREALINAFLHAHSGEIEVAICYSPKVLSVRVLDDGRGIDPEVLASGGRSSHWGLRGMRERASKIRGHLDIRSRVDGGTEIELIVPGSVAYDGTRSKSNRPSVIS